MENLDLARSRHEYQIELERTLAGLVAKLKDQPEVLCVSVFGSYARGRADLFTDLDVLIIMETALPFPERQRRLYEMLAAPVDLDLLCYTPQEFEFVKDRPFFRHALRDQKILYEKKPA